MEKILKDKADKLLEEIYMRGYHDGRHTYRDKLVKSGLICANPQKQDEFLKLLESPCSNCPNSDDNFKLGCATMSPAKCEKMKQHMLALDIKKHFS